MGIQLADFLHVIPEDFHPILREQIANFSMDFEERSHLHYTQCAKKSVEHYVKLHKEAFGMEYYFTPPVHVSEKALFLDNFQSHWYRSDLSNLEEVLDYDIVGQQVHDEGIANHFFTTLSDAYIQYNAEKSHLQGMYSPFTSSIFLRPDITFPQGYSHVVLLHEMGHAFMDQHLGGMENFARNFIEELPDYKQDAGWRVTQLYQEGFAELLAVETLLREDEGLGRQLHEKLLKDFYVVQKNTCGIMDVPNFHRHQTCMGYTLIWSLGNNGMTLQDFLEDLEYKTPDKVEEWLYDSIAFVPPSDD